MYRSDNPIRDAQRYYDGQDEEPHVYCAECGSAIFVGEMAYKIDNEWLCKDCMDDQYLTEVDEDDVV